MNAFLSEIYGQGDAIKATGAALNKTPVPGEIASLLKHGRHSFSGLILTGMGSSDYIASAGAMLLRGSGIPASYFNAGELLH